MNKPIYKKNKSWYYKNTNYAVFKNHLQEKVVIHLIREFVAMNILNVMKIHREMIL